MNNVRLIKIAMCFILVCVVAFAASLPAYAVDWDFMDEHGDEGKELWEAYKQALEPLKTDKYPTAIENIQDLSEKRYASTFEEITGTSQDVYNNMSYYDKTLVASTFIEPYYMSNLGYTYNNDTEWSTATNTFKMLFTTSCRDDGDDMKMKTAYNNLMYWQYQYYQSSGAFYNFMEEKDTLDYIDDKFMEELHAETKDNAESKVTSSKATSSVSNKGDKEKGIWDDFFANVKAHIFTIVLLCAFLIATAVIVIRKKRVNIQNNDNNNNI